MTTILEVVLGLILLYLVVSFVASAINEGVAGLFGWRAAYLERGIESLLGNMKADFYGHSIINSLTNPKALWSRTKRPSYISPSTFVEKTLDLLNTAAPPPAGARPA